MSLPLIAGNVARRLLLIQFIAVCCAGLLFCLKDPRWGASALAGGLAVWLPGALFMIFAWRHQAQKPAQGRMAWSFAICEVLKVIATFTLMVVALVCFNAVLLPLIVSWLLVLVVQILAPVVINNKG